jgi:hypothetical protein
MLSLARCYHGTRSSTAAATLLALVMTWTAHAADNPGPALPAAAWPPQFTAEYNVYNRGVKVAEMRRVMAPGADGNYVFSSSTHTTGLFSLLRKDRIEEESRWQLADGIIRSLAYTSTRSGNRERKVGVRFDWDARRIISTISDESWRMPGVPQVVDKLLYQFALMTDLRAGAKEFNYTVADGGKIKIYTIEPLGEESVKTPLGKFQSMKFRHQRLGDDRVTTLWCAPRFEYLPVQVEYLESDGSKTRIVLRSVNGL